MHGTPRALHLGNRVMGPPTDGLQTKPHMLVLIHKMGMLDEGLGKSNDRLFRRWRRRWHDQGRCRSSRLLWRRSSDAARDFRGTALRRAGTTEFGPEPVRL